MSNESYDVVDEFRDMQHKPPLGSPALLSLAKSMRDACLAQAEAWERLAGIEPRTSQIRRWFKKWCRDRGAPKDALTQIPDP